MAAKKAPEPVNVLRGHTSDVQALAFLPDGRLLAGDADGAIKLWDVGVRRATHTHRAHSASAGVLGVGAVPGADDALLTQGRDGTLKRWQLLPDGSLCDRPSASISTGSYNFCRFAVLGARQPLRQRAGPAPCVGSTAAEDAAADEAKLRGDAVDVDSFLAPTPPEAPGEEAADSDDEPGSEEEEAAGGASACVSAVVALAGTDPAKIELWDLASAECAVRLGPPPPADGAERAGMLMALRLHAAPSGALYALGGYEDGCVRLWDVRAPRAPLLRLALHKEPVMALALDARGRRGASGAADAQVVQFELNIAAGSSRRGVSHSAAARGSPASARGVSELTFRREGRLLAAAGWDGRVRLYDAKRAAPLASLRYHAAAATALAWAHDARGTLASGARDGTIALWQVYPPQPPEPRAALATLSLTEL